VKTIRLHRKLLGVITSLATLAALTLVLFFLAINYVAIRSHIDKKNEEVLQKLERVLSVPLLKKDYVMIVDIIDEEVKSSNLRYIWVLDPGGSVIACNDEEQIRLPIKETYLKDRHFSRYRMKSGYTLCILSSYSLIYQIQRIVLIGGLVFLALLVLIIYGISRWLGNSISAPVQEVVDASVHVAGGNFDVSVNPSEITELNTMAKALNTMGNDLKELTANLSREKSLLSDSEQRYRRLVENFRDEYFFYSLTAEGKLVYCSPSVESILGYPPAQAKQKFPAILTSADCNEDFHLHRQKTLAGAAQPPWEIEVKHGLSGVRQLELMEVPVFGDDGELRSVEGIAHDITRKKQITARLEKSQRKFADLVRLMPQTLFETDQTGMFTFINTFGAEQLGHDPLLLLNRLTLTDVIIPSCHAQLADVLGDILEGKDVRDVELTAVDSAGSQFPVLLYASPLEVDGKVRGLRGIAINITRRRRAEEALIQAQKMETIGNLAGGIAHDFNNILNGIMGTISLLQLNLREGSTGTPEEIAEDYGVIQESCERAADIVKQLMVLARKSEEHSSVLVDLNAIVERVIKISRNSLHKSVTASAMLFDGPAMTVGDPTQFEQVLLNLVVNGAHAMTIMRAEGERWGGELSIAVSLHEPREEEFVLEPSPATAWWHVTISDTGVGMDDQTLQQIFDPFFTTKDKREGTGLGLAMVYHIVTQHGGSLDVTSTPGRGSTFTISLPRAEGKKEAPREHGADTKLATGSGTILVVDDELVGLNLTARILRKVGYTVLTASSGTAALKLFEDHASEIRLALLDMLMPDMNGTELFAKMREISPKVRVVFTSGLDDKAVVKQCEDDGALGFIQKPVTADSLSRFIGEAMDAPDA